MTLNEHFHHQFIVPVVRVTNAELLEGTCSALVQGGLKILEITLMSDAAFRVIKKLSAHTDLVIGAGTVLDVAQAERAIDNGARFLIAPGLNLDVVDYANEREVAIIPGVLTPSEIMAAQAEGLEFLKLFPASAVGGPAYLNILKGPFPTMKWMPSGGVTLENLGDYKKAGAQCVGMGGELIPADAIQSKDWKRISQSAKDHLQAVAKLS